MALEAVVYPQALFPSNKDLYTLQDDWDNHFFHQQQQQQQRERDFRYESCSNYNNYNTAVAPEGLSDATATSLSRQEPKRRRARCRKNQEDIENQRMTHIAVERNRRKQMNEYLSMLKSLMPDSYVQRADQASIVGGAINYVKELENKLHLLSTQQKRSSNSMAPNKQQLPFQEFFSFPQYSTTVTTTSLESSSVADVEVSMVETHANMKIRTTNQPKQLLKLVSGLQGLNLTVLHLNVSTSDQFALYCLSLRVEDNTELNSADEIATSVHQLLSRIQDGASSSSSSS